MKTFRVTFNGRKKGAIGIIQTFTAEVTAKDQERARLALYELGYEHISIIYIAEASHDRRNG